MIPAFKSQGDTDLVPISIWCLRVFNCVSGAYDYVSKQRHRDISTLYLSEYDSRL